MKMIMMMMRMLMRMMMMMMMLMRMMMMRMGVGRYFGNVENATLQLSQLEMLGIPKTSFFYPTHFLAPYSQGLEPCWWSL